MLRAKFDGNSLTTFDKLLLTFLWTQCIYFLVICDITLYFSVVNCNRCDCNAPKNLLVNNISK